jgi:hypothetical protein
MLANHRLAEALGHPYEHVLGRRSEDLLRADIAAHHRRRRASARRVRTPTQGVRYGIHRSRCCR